ncbi:MAG: hypothetical protein RLN76_03215 [Phycisphaeraceae bacterium]
MTPKPLAHAKATSARVLAFLPVLLLLLSQSAAAQSFTGWQGLRVIELDGNPYRLDVADLNQDGREDLVLVNTRQARLEIFHWLNPENREPFAKPDPDDPASINDLPMAPELKRTEVPVSQLPHDVLILDTDSDATPELYVLVSDPNRILQFTPDDLGNWTPTERWELRAGRFTPADDLLLAFSSDGNLELLISLQEGIQRLTLTAPKEADIGRASWIEPRESLGRNDWWLADLDDDGHDDLVEWTNTDDRSLRWYPVRDGTLRPAQTLYDRPISGAVCIRNNNAADEIVVLEASPAGLVRRYRMTRGDTEDLGRSEPIALAGADKAVWAATTIRNEPTLVALDPEQPRATLFAHTPDGWSQRGSFPVIASVKAATAPPAQPGTILLWPDEGADLFNTQWADGRLSFPQPMGLASEAEDRLILGLGHIGDTTWWIQRADKDLHLGQWTTGGDPETTIFPAVANTAEQAIWLGGNRLLVLDKFARTVRLVTLADDGTANSTTPSHLSKARIEEFKLFDTPDGIRLGRFTDGVLQWLDDDLFATDQVMLPDGLPLADLVLREAGLAWALEQGGSAIHGMAPDDSGVLRVVSTTRTNRGRSLIDDLTLGLIMPDQAGVTRLAEGRPLQLDANQSIDARAGRPAGTSNATVHRVLTTDVTGDNADDLILADDVRHQITLMTPNDDHQLAPDLSWPVFEDKTYPYGGTSDDDQITEPRRIIGIDIDGDGHQDLALLSHDRLLIYLARENQP